MEPEQEIRVGVLGLGLMGRTHVEAYEHARQAGLGCRVVAVCDRDLDRARDTQSLGLGSIATFDEPGRLFDLDGIDLVSICTHTDSHVDLACEALAAGKNVLVEKPVALNSAAVERLLAAEASATGFCMPAMCMRFWPGWSWLRSAIDDGRFGAVTSAVFRRLSPTPIWAPDFYAHPSKCGGALFDLHVHDVDLIAWLFGRPTSLRSFGSPEHLTTSYRFRTGPAHVSAEGAWIPAADFPFQMGYTVVFERACASFALGASPELTMFTNSGEDPGASKLEVRGAGSGIETGYQGEIRHALAACRGAALSVTLADAAEVTRLLEAEHSSLERGAEVTLPAGS